MQKKNASGLPAASSSAFGDAAQTAKMNQLEAQDNVEASAKFSGVWLSPLSDVSSFRQGRKSGKAHQGSLSTDSHFGPL